MTAFLFVFLGIIFILLVWIISMYNRMVSLKNRIENAWSQIDVQLRRRYDLIPNLVETVKGYAAHEQNVLENVTQARAAVTGAQGIKEQSEAQNVLSGALKNLFAVAESYPELKANENFMLLQEELSGTESKIAYSRQFYNDTVLAFNTMIQSFPSNILAGMSNYQPKEYFESDEQSREPVKVKF